MNGRVGQRLGSCARLAVAAALLGACAPVQILPKGDGGFHRASRFRAPAPGLSAVERERLYGSYRATVDHGGVQVGLVPMDESLFSAYLEGSGFGPETSRVPLRVDPYTGRLAEDPSVDPEEGAMDEDADAARRYNLSLLKRLDLPVGDDPDSPYKRTPGFLRNLFRIPPPPGEGGAASPFRGLPPPLDQTDVEIGVNAGFGDWVWDRSLHQDGWDLEVGGQVVPWEDDTVPDYFLSQNCGRLADEYRSAEDRAEWGGSLITVGDLLWIGGFLVFLAHPGVPPAVAAGLGVVAMPVGVVVSSSASLVLRGLLKRFNAEIPGKLRERMQNERTSPTRPGMGPGIRVKASPTPVPAE